MRLPRLHLIAVVVADEVQHGVHERPAPRVADDLRADDDVAELPRQARRQLVARVERERERIRRLVDPEVLPLQLADLGGRDAGDPELTVVDALGREHTPHELDSRALLSAVLPAKTR